jgi:hypothetical protein
MMISASQALPLSSQPHKDATSNSGIFRQRAKLLSLVVTPPFQPFPLSTPNDGFGLPASLLAKTITT